jgi:hypothetical protein
MRKIRERRADSTADTDDHCLRKQVLPQLGELRLHECDVAQLDAFLTRLERARRTVEHVDGTTSERPMYAANTRRQIRAIVSGVLQQAVLHKTIPTNPVRELERIESPKGHRTAPPRGLTPEEHTHFHRFGSRNMRFRAISDRLAPARERHRPRHARPQPARGHPPSSNKVQLAKTMSCAGRGLRRVGR